MFPAFPVSLLGAQGPIGPFPFVELVGLFELIKYFCKVRASLIALFIQASEVNY